MTATGASSARALEIDDARRLLRAPGAEDHKRTRGVLLLATGSERYPGAAVLGAAGALGVGLGMARHLGPASVGQLVLGARPEVVLGDGEADASVLGSGIADASEDERAQRMLELLESEAPVVVDAGALELVDGERELASAVLTPHAGELGRALERLGLAAPDGEADADGARRLADESGAVVLLKGAATRIARPGSTELLEVEAPLHWSATAGTGDVLGGAIGAVCAQAAAEARREGRPAPDAAELAELAACGAWLHAWASWAAARRAAGDPIGVEELLDAQAHPAMAEGPSGPITALGLAEALPLAVAAALAA
ncbi:Bifunctional NAD(P)H-hydrate repair enzyme Nnr [Pseudoclavibacter triregionum]|nr:Bifunctional NAD(P)H-hydrate repair enzyme Nnr [Pseudoclavibacter triregionum]